MYGINPTFTEYDFLPYTASMKKHKATKRVEIRVSERELATIDRYCTETSRTRADVLREFIRTLAPPKPARPR